MARRWVQIIWEMRIVNMRKLFCEIPFENSCEKVVKCERHAYAKLAF